MGPFRSELEASHARIAQLEAEKSELERQNVELQRRLKQSKQKETRGAPSSFSSFSSSSRAIHPAWIAVIPTVTTVFITATAVLVGTWRPTCPDLTEDVTSFKGIGIAPPPAFAPPVPSPLPLLKKPDTPHVDNSWSPYRASPSRPRAEPRRKQATCDCAANDPLCSCL